MSKRKKKKSNPDALFGELRAVLQQPHIAEGVRIHVWGLCVRMHRNSHNRLRSKTHSHDTPRNDNKACDSGPTPDKESTMSKRKKKKPNPDLLFGELRAIIQPPTLTNGQRTHLWNICSRMHAHYPELYAQQWVPYLKSYATEWQPEQIVCRSLDELIKACQLAPFARFTFSARRIKTYSQDMDGAWDEKLFKILSSPHIKAITALELDRHGSLSQWLSFTEHLTKVRVIHGHHLLFHHLLEDIAGSTSQDTLTELVLHCDELDFDMRQHDYTHIDTLPALRTLDLTRITVDMDTSKVVHDHITPLIPLLGSLHRLRLAHMMIDDASLGALVTPFDTLPWRSLDLSGLRIRGSDTSNLIALLHMLPNLTELILRESFVGFRPVALCVALADMPTLKLEHLDLSGSVVGIQALRKLAASPHLTHLRALVLEHIPLRDTHATLFATHPFFARLDMLQIMPEQLDPNMAATLARSTTLKPHLSKQFSTWKPGLRTWYNT